jgi:O-antigen/teichoic acid export membrane protein
LDGFKELARIVRASTGVRASALLVGGVAANIAGGYAYNLLCIRWLGAKDYGQVAALTAIATIVLLPLLGVQAALAREVATFEATENRAANGALLRLTLRRTLFLAVLLLGVLLAFAPVIREVLKITALASVVATALLVATGVALPILQGFLQGLERFGRITFALAVYGFGRPLLAMPLVLAGFGVVGALSATTIAGLVASGILFYAVSGLLSRPAVTSVALELKDFTPVIVGLLGFTVLMNSDVIAAKIFLSDADAGTYAAAALIGKLAALLPAGAIAPVLLPRATARIERGHDPARLVMAALAAAAVFGTALTLALLAVPASVVEWAFGAQFGGAAVLLAPCAAVMTLCGIINVHLTFAFALRDRWLVAVLCAGAVVDVALLAVLHDSAYEILAATALAALAVIALHEARSPAAAWRLLRAAT